MNELFKDSYCLLVSVDLDEYIKNENIDRSSNFYKELCSIVDKDRIILCTEDDKQSFIIRYSLEEVEIMDNEELTYVLYQILACLDSFGQTEITSIIDDEIQVYELN